MSSLHFCSLCKNLLKHQVSNGLKMQCHICGNLETVRNLTVYSESYHVTDTNDHPVHADLVLDKTLSRTLKMKCPNPDCPSRTEAVSPEVVIFHVNSDYTQGYICTVCKSFWRFDQKPSEQTRSKKIPRSKEPKPEGDEDRPKGDEDRGAEDAEDRPKGDEDRGPEDAEKRAPEKPDESKKPKLRASIKPKARPSSTQISQQPESISAAEQPKPDTQQPEAVAKQFGPEAVAKQSAPVVQPKQSAPVVQPKPKPPPPKPSVKKV